MKQPTDTELALLRLAEHGLITDAEIGHKLKCTRQNAGLRMWRAHKWQLAQKRLSDLKR